ncbi:MAG: class I SAM-dependent methyltransferase [Pseudomonadota bacterium]
MWGPWIWNSWAPVYERLWVQDWVLGKTRDAVRQRLHEVGGDARSVLDVGCGTGQLLDEIAQLRPGLQLHGLDPSSAMIAQARQRHGRVDYRVGRLCDEDRGPFDLVCMCNAFPYVSDHDRAARELFRLTRPGGRCWIVQGNTETLYDVLGLAVIKLTVSRSTYHSARELHAIFCAAGFDESVTRMIDKALWLPSVQLCEFVRPVE